MTKKARLAVRTLLCAALIGVLGGGNAPLHARVSGTYSGTDQWACCLKDKEVVIDSSGNLLPGSTTNTQTLGTSAIPWVTAFITTLTLGGSQTIASNLTVTGSVTAASVIGSTVAWGDSATRSTGTANGALALVGALTGTSAAFSTTLDAAGQTTFGAAPTKSTFTTAGALATFTSITAGTSLAAGTSITAVGNITGTGNGAFGAGSTNTISTVGLIYAGTNTASLTGGTLVAVATGTTASTPILKVTDASGLVALQADTNGLIYIMSRTLAQIHAITPRASGGWVRCSDCSPANIVCQSTGTAVDQFAISTETAAGCR